jgi:hypothetical protein
LNWGSDTRGLKEKLASPAYYRQAIVALHRKWSLNPYVSLHAGAPEGYSFAQAYFHRRRFARALVRSLASGGYRFAPATIGHVTTDKRRTVYRFTLTDRIVHGALALMLASDLHRLTPPYVYSYVKGRSRMQAVAAWTAYVHAHRRERPDVKTRGLFVLRFDIQSYGESIPVMPSSSLWAELEDYLRRAWGRMPAPEEKALLGQLVRPEILHPEGGLYQPVVGIPDGAPVSALLLNLYLRPLDEALAGVAGGFYARFGDDMLFAHPDVAVFNAAVAQIDGILTALSLTRNQRKTKARFYNGAGRGAQGLEGATHIEYLGCSLAFSGGVGLKNRKMRLLLRDLAARAKSTAAASSALSFDERGRLVCAALNRALDLHAPHAHPYSALLMTVADDRDQLKQLDYWLARTVLRVMLGDRNARAFRKLSYRRIRHDWGLRSVAYARNRR